MVRALRALAPVIQRDGRLTNEAYTMLEEVVNALNGLKDENDFLYTIIAGVRITIGSGAPGGVVSGSPPDVYLNTAGGAGTTLYIKESGVGTAAGWVGK